MVTSLLSARMWMRLTSLAVSVGAVLLVLSVAMIGGALSQSGGAYGQPGSIKAGAVPVEWVPHYESAGQTCEFVSPVMLAAQGKVESGLRADAIGPVTRFGWRAEGVAQFSPDTWAAYGRDGNGDGVANPFDPADAIPAQAAYLCWLADLLGDIPGDLEALVFSGYNAGPYGVLRTKAVLPATQGYVDDVKAAMEEMAAPMSFAGAPVGGQALPGYPRLGNGLGPNAEYGRQLITQTFGIYVGVYDCFDGDGQGHVPNSYHYSGHACDVMLGSDRAIGMAIAQWAVANAESLGVVEVIHNRQIWSASRGTWKAYGGANPHTGHVHLSFDRTPPF